MTTSDSRASRRSRHSPRASASSDSSRDSASPSGSSGHHHHSSSSHTVPSTVIKLGTSSSRRSDNNASIEASASSGNHDSSSSATQGFQGIYVSNLPSSRTESFLRDGLANFFKKFGKVIHIVFEIESGPNFVEQRRALVIFQRGAELEGFSVLTCDFGVLEIENLLFPIDKMKYQLVLRRLVDADKLKDTHHLFGLRLKIRFASHSAVTEAYSTHLATNGLESSQDASTSGSMVDALANRASRTLYVGGLERRTTDDSLRSRFSYFGHILETGQFQVKNWESPAPFAFIQFADIHSVVCAINTYAQSAHSSGSKGKLKMNWGRTIVSNKIWIGELPSSCSADYLREKIRVSFTDTFNEVIYDPRHREALLLFSNNDSAQRAFSMIKTKQVAFWNADEKKDVHVPVDYCSEKLHDYFVDRKFRGESGSAFMNGTGSSSYASGSAPAFSTGSSGIASASTSSLLAPPPDPPSHLRDAPSRTDYRRSGSNMMSRRRRSGERESSRNASRSLRYSSYNRSRRRRERAKRNDVSPSSSSTSSTSSDSDLSSSSTADRRRAGAGHSKCNIQRLHRDKTSLYSSNSRLPTSPSNNAKSDRNIEPINSTASISLQSATSSGSRAGLAQLLPPPIPSAPILNPILASPGEKKQQQYQQTSEASIGERESNERFADRQQSVPSSSLSVDNEPVDELKTAEEQEQQIRKIEEQQQSDAIQSEKGSQDTAFSSSVNQGNFNGNELSAITSNRIEEIANTLVNVLQHHSKASTSTTASAPLAIISGMHHSHSLICSTHRSADEACDSNRHHSGRGSTSFFKRTKWPWGNDPIKNHCAIPLDGSANRGRDPRHRKHSPQSSISLPLPKFIQEHRSTPSSSRRNSLPDSFRSPQHQKQDSRRSKNAVSASSSGLPGSNLKWSVAENSPPHKTTRGRTHSSISRSESSNSEAMLSPDPSNSTAQLSLVSTIDIFGDTSPANNSSAYRERLDALGATFQNIEQKFQKTKQNTHLDYDRKGSSQRSYKFEEELERLKARSGSSGPNVTASQAITTTCSHSTTNTFSDSFMRARSSGTGTPSLFDSKDVESQKLNRTPLSVSIPMPPAPLTPTASGSYTAVFYTTCTSSPNLPSPQFSSAQLRKPPLPPNITHSNNQTPSSAAASRIAYPPDFSIPPPPLPQPPVPPSLSVTTFKPATVGSSLISAPPPPPPLICGSASHSFDPTLLSSNASLVRSIVTQGAPQSSAWRTAVKPSTPPPPTAHSTATSKISLPSTSNPPKPSTSSPFPAVIDGDKIKSRTQGVDKVKEKEHLKTSSRPHVLEKKISKESAVKQPSLSELFRQQARFFITTLIPWLFFPNSLINDLKLKLAQDSSEVRKKQLKKVGKEKDDEVKHHKANDENKKRVTEGTKEKQFKENEKKISEKSDQSLTEKEKDKKHTDGRVQLQEMKVKVIPQKQQKEKKERRELKKDRDHEEGGELTVEKKKTQRSLERNLNKSKPIKDGTSIKQKEKEQQLRRDRAKKKQESERLKPKEKEKEQERKKKELTKKKRKRKKDSSTSMSEETSSSEAELHSFDRELKRLFMEEEASGSLGLSMYDRVKQRSSSKPDDAAKKNRALELLHERTQSRRNNEQNRPKRIQLESSSSEEEKDSSNDDESESSSGPLLDLPRARNRKKKKSEPKSKSQKKTRTVLRKKLTEEETEYNDRDDDDDEVEKDSESFDSDEERSKRKRSRKTASKLSKKQKKTSLSLDDVFGTYSTDDESTKYSRGSIVPSLYKEKDEKEESGKKVPRKMHENQRSRNEKEKAENSRSSNLKKERKKEKLEEADESGVEEKETNPQKAESFKQTFETEKKIGNKRFSKGDEEIEVTSVKVPVKKQKAEKSLIEISMFREDEKKLGKAKTSATSDQKKKSRKPGVDRQFEKKLAKKLRREQKERHEEQKREVVEAKQKDEDLKSGKQQEMGRTGSGTSDSAILADIAISNERSPETDNHNFEDHSTKCARKRHFKVENSEEVKRRRKNPKSPKMRLSQTDSDSCEDLKTRSVVLLKQESTNKPLQKVGSDSIRDISFKSEAKNDSLSGSTDTGPDLLLSKPLTAEMDLHEVDSVLEDCETNTALHTISNECNSPGNTLHDESEQPKNYDSVEQELRSDVSLAAGAVTDSRSRHPVNLHNVIYARVLNSLAKVKLEHEHSDENQPQEPCTSEDDEVGGGGREGKNVDRDVVIGRRNSVSSTNSSESGQTSLLSTTSSANLETQLEDGPDDQKQQISGSDKTKNSGSTEVLKAGGGCGTEQEFVEKTESEEKPSPSDVIQLASSDRVIFVPNSDAECSTDGVIHGQSDAPVKQQQQSQSADGSRASILDNVNDAESNGSFELIDEGRIDSYPDQDVDSDISGAGQQHCQESVYEAGHVRKEKIMEAEEEHADGSECAATVRMQDDVHDVQETEFAVQSIVLDDNRSQHSGEDGSAAMDYLSEGSNANSGRDDILTDTTKLANINLSSSKQQENSLRDNADTNNDDNIAIKPVPDAESQEMELEDGDESKGKTDVDDKRSDSHLDEVIDDVVAGGYMEVDAEQLMRINSKKAKEEAVLRAAAASSQGNITQKAVSSTGFISGPDTSQPNYDYQNPSQGAHVQQQQYGSSYIQQPQPQPQQQSQLPQQIPLQQGVLSQPSQQQQQLQQNVVHGGSHILLQQRPQQLIGQTVMQQQQQSSRLTSYQQSQPQIMKVPETPYLQPQHLPPIEQRVQGTAALSQQQPHSLQSKSVTTSNLSYYPGRNTAQQGGTGSFTSPQMSLQQQQQQHMLLQQQTDNMQSVTGPVNASSVHTVSQIPDMRQQVVQAATQQQAQLVPQSHLQQPQQQSVNYGSPMMTPACSVAAVAAAQTVAAASRQLDLNKQMSLSAPPLQPSISSNPYDLYANLPKKPTTGIAQPPQHQQQTSISQQQQQVKVAAEVRQNCSNSSSLSTPLMGRTGAASSSAIATNLQGSRSNASASVANQANRVMPHQQQQQQLSPTAQQAVAFAIGLPGTTSPFTQMQQQYLQQWRRLLIRGPVSYTGDIFVDDLNEWMFSSRILIN
uniref:RRM domain-containing protein n=1 Tax=Setaria digitata TaxID=48799 RepID=A0A915Q4P4_9BILA